jgi:phosphoglycolate phosphatase
MKLAVFDVDGTLVDSRQTIKASCDAAFAYLGRPAPTYDAVRQIVGLSLRDGLSRLAPDLGEEELERLTEGYRQGDIQRVTGIEEDLLYPGAAELLAGGWKIGMATGKSRKGVERWLKVHGWSELFHTTHCADDGPGKPHPSMVLEAMKALGATPAQTLMIGDTAHDIEMGKAAGVATVAVTWGFHTRDELVAAEPDHLCETFAELESVLVAFSGI